MEYPRLLSSSCIAAALALHVAPAGAAEGCTQTSTPIATDRPDVTNSSVVVPVGSLQNENGANVSRRAGADVFDGTNSRWRLGIAPCFEVLIDLPNYVGTFRGVGASGFGNVAPAFKWQISPAPGKVDLSVPGPNGIPLKLNLRAMTVWRVDHDGQWRCVVDISNEEPAAAPIVH